MRYLSRLLLGIILAVSLGGGAFAHSLESVGAHENDPCSLSSSELQAPVSDGTSDPGKAASHIHGGCHAHQFAQPAISADSALVLETKVTLLGRDYFGLPLDTPDRTLRPPIA